MVRIQDSTTSESSEVYSTTSDDQSSWDSDSTEEIPTRKYESDRGPWSDDGVDGCKCAYDYRGDVDELFCPRCRQRVYEDYDDDNDWYCDQQEIVIFPLSLPTNPIPTKPIPAEKLHIDRNIQTRDSDDSFDSWPSADEEEVINKEGKLETFRLAQVVKKDLEHLTGSGRIEDKDYDGDEEETDQKQLQRKKRMTKRKYTERKR